MAARTPPLTLTPKFTAQLAAGYGRFVLAKPWEKITFSTYLRQLIWLGLQQMEAELDAIESAEPTAPQRSTTRKNKSSTKTSSSPARIRPDAAPAIGRPRKKLTKEEKERESMGRAEAAVDMVTAASVERRRLRLEREDEKRKELKRLERKKSKIPPP